MWPRPRDREPATGVTPNEVTIVGPAAPYLTSAALTRPCASEPPAIAENNKGLAGMRDLCVLGRAKGDRTPDL